MRTGWPGLGPGESEESVDPTEKQVAEEETDHRGGAPQLADGPSHQAEHRPDPGLASLPPFPPAQHLQRHRPDQRPQNQPEGHPQQPEQCAECRADRLYHLGCVRRLLEQDPAQPRYLQTVWGLGYVFVPEERA